MTLSTTTRSWQDRQIAPSWSSAAGRRFAEQPSRSTPASASRAGRLEIVRASVASRISSTRSSHVPARIALPEVDSMSRDRRPPRGPRRGSRRRRSALRARGPRPGARRVGDEDRPTWTRPTSVVSSLSSATRRKSGSKAASISSRHSRRRPPRGRHHRVEVAADADRPAVVRARVPAGPGPAHQKMRSPSRSTRYGMTCCDPGRLHRGTRFEPPVRGHRRLEGLEPVGAQAVPAGVAHQGSPGTTRTRSPSFSGRWPAGSRRPRRPSLAGSPPTRRRRTVSRRARDRRLVGSAVTV